MYNLFDTNNELDDAVLVNNIEKLRSLLRSEKYSNPSVKYMKSNALHLAMKNKNMDMITLLVEYGADAKFKDCETSENCLHLAVKTGDTNLVNLFLQYVDVNALSKKQLSALHLAVIAKNSEISKLLLNQGADATLTTEDYSNCLHLAAASDDVYLLSLFLGNNDVNDINLNGFTPLHIAIMSKNQTVTQLLLNSNASLNIQNVHGNTSLHLAIINKDVGLVKNLLMRGAKTNVVNNDGNSAFHLSFELRDLEVTRLFLERGADVNFTNIRGESPLHLAVKSESREIVEKLLRIRGILVEEKDKNGVTPMQLAVSDSLCENNLAIFNLIVSFKAGGR